MNIIPIFAAISGNSLINLLIWIIVIGVIYGLLHWLLNTIALPEPFNKFARVILVVIAVVFLINALLSLVGKPFITF